MGRNLIFVEAFQAIRAFPTRLNFNYYDPVENQFVKKSVMLQTHLTSVKQINNLPQQIDKTNILSCLLYIIYDIIQN